MCVRVCVYVCVCVCVCACGPFATSWTVAQQAPLHMESSRQEHWTGLLLPPPGYLPDPGTEPTSPACVSCTDR